MKPKERNEARKEVAVLSKLKHPNIVEYEESFEGLNACFIFEITKFFNKQVLLT